MEKRVTAEIRHKPTPPEETWLNLQRLAEVEITSEEPKYQVESALLPGGKRGWRAGEPGEQLIRLIFNEPQGLRRIRLHFLETERERTQEIALKWSPDGGKTYYEIVRQQWNFSPEGSTEEVEDYHVELAGVTVLELTIIPDIRKGDARATLASMRLA
ncbi:MAG: carbohydrate-binding protein [Chitinivibrionales bacterium]|nr:carbohydrate-binding protein [Chitinivibrionales bacterium]MBD3355540.1 carbohydrate-binding protein [Chitinivibrionales bacterium]